MTLKTHYTRKEPNKNKVQTFKEGDARIYSDIMDFEYQLNGSDKKLGDIISTGLDDIENIKEENKYLKNTLKVYISKQAQIERLLASSIELLSIQINDIKTLIDKGEQK